MCSEGWEQRRRNIRKAILEVKHFFLQFRYFSPGQIGGSQTGFGGLLPHLDSTAFQQRVWKALQEIPRGETRTYSGLAADLGAPSSTRAVAGACAANPVAVLVPCHRIVGKSGSLTGYRWGVERKRKLLEAEKKSTRIA